MNRFALLALVGVTLAACATDSADDTTSAMTSVTADTATAPVQAAQSAAPRLEFFSSSDSVMAVVDGAGCGYSAPGVTGDSSLFAFSQDGIIRVNGRLERMTMVGDGTYTDSTGESRWENARYRLDLRTSDDSTVEAGVAQHGEMTVEDKRTGGKTTVNLIGGCGC